MADLFTNPSTNLFADLPDEKPAPLEPTSVGRTARLAAIANANVTERGAKLVEQIDVLTSEYDSLIKTYGDNTLRQEAASRQQSRQLQGLSALMADVKPFDEDGSLQRDVVAASQAVINQDIETRKKYALEQEALEKIQDLAHGGDAVQAKLLMNNLELGDANQRLRDIDTKRLILMREIEKAQIAKEDQSWFSDASDFLLDWIPLNRSLGRGGNVDIQKGLTHWYDAIQSGERVRNEASTLWNMPVEQFSDYVTNDLIPNIKANSTLLGIHSNSEQRDLLS